MNINGIRGLEGRTITKAEPIFRHRHVSTIRFETDDGRSFSIACETPDAVALYLGTQRP